MHLNTLSKISCEIFTYCCMFLLILQISKFKVQVSMHKIQLPQMIFLSFMLGRNVHMDVVSAYRIHLIIKFFLFLHNRLVIRYPRQPRNTFGYPRRCLTTRKHQRRPQSASQHHATNSHDQCRGFHATDDGGQRWVIPLRNGGR